jgi:O-antigen/teichoic acid export membrane protein
VLSALSGRRVPWGAVATLSGEAFSRLSLVAFQFIVANGLGAEQYGTIGLVMSFAAVFLPLADFGLSNLALRRLANNGDPDAFPALLGLKLVLTAAYGIIVLVAASSTMGTERALAVILAAAYWALNSLTDFVRQCLRARERSLDEFRARLVQPFLFCAAMALFWLWKPGIAGTLVLWSVPFAGLLLAYRAPLRRGFTRLRPVLRGTWSFLAGHSAFMWQSATYLFLVTLSGRIELWLVDARTDRVSVGAYFAAYNMVFTGIFFAQALSAHMYPRLHRPGSGGRWRALSRALVAHAGLAGGAIAATLAVGPWLFSMVFRADGFAQGTMLLPVMAVLLGFSILNYLWLVILIGLNRQWLASVALLVILPAKIVLGWMWLPDHGAIAMAWAGLWAEGPACLVLGWITCRMYLRRGA